MDIQVVLQELDDLFIAKKITQIEPFLQQKLKETLFRKDLASAITITNELIGFYRDTSQYEKSDYYCEQIIILMKELGLEHTISYATTLLNVANAYRASGKLEVSFEYYQKVLQIYHNNLEKADFRYASFYNNFSLLYQEMQEFEKARECLENALCIVLTYEDAIIELATTHTNLAVSLLRCNRASEAMSHINIALEIFERDLEKDFHYSAALAAMGEAQYCLQDFELAEKYYKQALQEMEQSLGKTTAYRITEENLKKVYQKQGKQSVSGLELCRMFYEEYGKPMIKKKFPAYQNQIAVGLVGEGSECFGFDDEISRDHDFGPGLCFWLSSQTYQKIGVKLQEEYDKLPTTFMGVTRIVTKEGRQRVGVFEIGEFYERIIGCQTVPTTKEQWMVIPEERLATATNGQVFYDKENVFTSIREGLRGYYPASLWHKKLATEAAFLSQAGQYNYERMLKRNEIVAVNLAFSDFLMHTMQMVYLLNQTFAPYFKWMHRGIKALPNLSKVSDLLVILCEKTEPFKRIELMNEIVALLIEECKKQGLTTLSDPYMGHHTTALLQEKTSKEDFKMTELKNSLIAQIIKQEWNAFDKVENKGGRADCQDDFKTFDLMRRSQYLAWNEILLEQYLIDFELAVAQGRNLISEKYAWMMESTAPEEFMLLKKELPVISTEAVALIEQIVAIQLNWREEFSIQYPTMSANARAIYTTQDSMFQTSYETYLRGELKTYSNKLLYLYGQFVVSLAKAGENLATITMNNTAILYGYTSLEDAERKMID